MIERTCERCNTTFARIPSKMGRFCSPQCANGQRLASVCGYCSAPFSRPPSRRRLFCSNLCANRSRAVPVPERVCERCNATFKRNSGRFCSPVCADTSRRTPVLSCEQCGKTPLNKGARRFCSRECANAAVERPQGTCRHCSKSFRKNKPGIRFCSNACANAARRMPIPACKQCGKPTGRQDRKYCSTKCLGESRKVLIRGTCPTCAGPVTGKGATYCSLKCAIEPRKLKPRFCESCSVKVSSYSSGLCPKCYATKRRGVLLCVVCGNARTNKVSNKTCSPECSTKLRSRSRNPAYTDDVLAKIAQLRTDGNSIPRIAAALSMTTGQVAALLSRLHIPTPAILIRKPRDKKPPKPKVYKVRVAPPPRVVPVVQRDLRRAIPMREVIRYASELGVPRRDFMDVNVVSKAMRRADPTHPGFRLESPNHRMNFRRHA